MGTIRLPEEKSAKKKQPANRRKGDWLNLLSNMTPHI
jgi:hypothetical protein